MRSPVFGLGLIALTALVPGAWASSVIPSQDMSLAAEAFQAADTGDWVLAENTARRATDPLALNLLLWRDLQRQNSGHSFDEIAAFVAAHPGWPHLRTLVVRAEDVMDGVPDATLLAWFRQHPPISPQAKLRFATLLTSSEPTRARALVRDAWVNGNFSEQDAAKALAQYYGMLQPKDHIDRLNRLLWDGRYDEARFMLSFVPADWKLLATARIKLGTSAKGALAAYAHVPPELRHDPGLQFDLMRWYVRKGSDEDALAILEHPPKELGRPAAWWPYRQSTARDLLNQNDYQRAYTLIQDSQLPDGQQQAEAEFTAGWIALRFLKSPALAYPHFVRLHDQSTRPLSVSRGAYWAGRAAEAEGNTGQALSWYDEAAKYGTTYYGQLAAAMPGVTPPPRPVPEPHADAAATAAFDQKELVRAILLLAQLGEQEDDVKPFFAALLSAATNREDYTLLADLAESIGRPDLGVAVAKDASYQGIALYRAGYPLVPMPRNAGAEQALMLALTRQESSFDQRAVSPTGARGLMQLEPDTARIVAASLSVPYSLDRLTSDATYNVTLGQAYFDGLISTFNGSYVLAIAAYNAGPARVEQWLAEYGDPRSPNIDAIDWVEEIPFGETRNYVQRVLENLQIYRLRIGNPALAFSLETDLRR
jgi:soluble lytic murein transglycosylase